MNAPCEGSCACPRCGGGFRCGAHDDMPCACAAVALSEALRAELRARFTGCLCTACLAAFSAADARERGRHGLATGRP